MEKASTGRAEMATIISYSLMLPEWVPLFSCISKFSAQAEPAITISMPTTIAATANYRVMPFN